MFTSACGDSETTKPDEDGMHEEVPGDGDADGDRGGKPDSGDGDADGDRGAKPDSGDGDGDATAGDGDGDATAGDGDGDGDSAPGGDGDGDGDSTPAACAQDTFDDDGDPATPCVAKQTCRAGSYISDPGDATRDRTCSPCAEGHYASGTNAARCEAWTTCYSGEYVWSAGSATRDRSCRACGQGEYTSAANQDQCQPWSCPAGKWSPVADGTTTSNQTCWTIKAQTLSLGQSHACAVFSNGRVACWGDNSCSQAGKPRLTTEHVTEPSWVTIPDQATDAVVDVAVDANSSCALTESGKVYCWGLDWASSNKATCRPTSDFSQPRRIEFAGAEGASDIRLKYIASQRAGNGTQGYCGVEVRSGLSVDRVWCWGDVQGLTPGYSAAHLMVEAADAPRHFKPRRIDMGPGGVFFIADNETETNQLYRLVNQGSAQEPVRELEHIRDGMIAFGFGSRPILHVTRTTKTQYVVYENEGHKLAYWGDVGPHHTQPTDVASPLKAPVWKGLTHAVDDAYSYTAGAVYRWKAASNTHGTPEQLSLSTSETISSFRTSGASHCFVAERGGVFCWGENDKGQLGDGSTNSRVYPQLIASPK